MATKISNTFNCRDCGTEVQWAVSKNGNKYLATTYVWHGDENPTAQRTFLPSHRCTPNPQWREQQALADAQRIADAQQAKRIEKGVTVEVHKGRKVTKGTIGVVFWVADEPDAYDVTKVGLQTADGQRHFININNVRCTTTDLTTPTQGDRQ